MSTRESWKATQYVYWVFTIDLHDRPDVEVPWKIPEKIISNVKALRGQHEIGKDNGRLHFQGYLELKQRTRFNKVKNMFSDAGIGWAHIEPRFGTHEEACKYVSKDDTRVDEPWADIIYGTFTPDSKVSPSDPSKPKGTGRGKTALNDELRKVSEEILSGKITMTDATCKYPHLAIRFPRGLGMLPGVRQEIQALKKREVKLHILWGDPGTGKSTHAEHMHYFGINENGTQNGIYYLPDYSSPNGGLPWHSGYNGEKTIVLDEFNSQMSVTQLNDYVSGRAKQQVQIKGGTCYLLHELVIIISNSSPDSWWNGLGATKHAVFDQRTGTTKLVHDKLFTAFMRRVSRIVHYKASDDLQAHMEQYVSREHEEVEVSMADVQELEEKNKRMMEISEKVQEKRTRELMESLSARHTTQEDEELTPPMQPVERKRETSSTNNSLMHPRSGSDSDYQFSDNHCGQPPSSSFDCESEQDLFSED